MLTQADIKEYLHYNSETGIFTWKHNRSTVKAGAKAGSLHKRHGYIYIQLKKVQYFAHRLAWMYVYGSWPSDQIDHINRNRSDNRICNLRVVTNQQNQWNGGKRKNNTSGYLGVYHNVASDRYSAHIGINNKVKNLGYFDNPVDAHKAYLKAKSELHVI